jgi:hypothetical protein
MEFLTWVTAGAVVLMGVAFLLHIGKEAKDAHGSTRT